MEMQNSTFYSFSVCFLCSHIFFGSANCPTFLAANTSLERTSYSSYSLFQSKMQITSTNFPSYLRKIFISLCRKIHCITQRFTPNRQPIHHQHEIPYELCTRYIVFSSHSSIFNSTIKCIINGILFDLEECWQTLDNKRMNNKKNRRKSSLVCYTKS